MIERGPQQEIFTRDYGKLRVHCYRLLDHNILVYAMRGFLADPEIERHFAELLDVASQYRPFAMIADPSNMKVLSAPAKRAIGEVFWPGIASLGIRRNPAITPDSSLTTLSIQQMIRSAGQRIETPTGTVEVAHFPTLDICIEWCLQGPSVHHDKS